LELYRPDDTRDHADLLFGCDGSTWVLECIGWRRAEFWTAASAVFGRQKLRLGCFCSVLFKTLIEPQRRGERVYPVDLAKEGLLREFTAKICEQIDAPQPKTIQFECSTRIAPTKGGGVLTLGLPVVASALGRAVAGIVAGLQALHRPRAGCRVVNLIRGSTIGCGGRCMARAGSIGGYRWLRSGGTCILRSCCCR